MSFLNMFKKKKSKEDDQDNKVLIHDLITLNHDPISKEEAIKKAGKLLVDAGYVEQEYLTGMKKREEKVTTYMGNGVAIPHGTNEFKKYINKSGISFIQFPEGIDFDDNNTCYLLIGIAGKGDDHMEILQNLATICQDEAEIEELITTTDKEVIIEKLVS